jgi:hypothetical protein
MSSSGRPWQDVRDRDLANFDTIDHEGIKRVRNRFRLSAHDLAPHYDPFPRSVFRFPTLFLALHVEGFGG